MNRDKLNKDRRNLKILSVCHYVLGGIGILCAMLAGVLFAGLGIAGLGAGQLDLGGLLVSKCLNIASAVVHLLAGFWLRNGLVWRLCLTVAIISLLQFPLGTILGIFTIVILARKSVRELFKAVRDDRVRKRMENAREGYQ